MIEQIKYKQYVIVPKNPRMSKGKIAAQVAHATFMALDYAYMKGIDFAKCYKDLLEWKENGMCVIVLQCKDTTELLSIKQYLDQWNIPNGLCIDEGLTEVRPMTPTALATGVLTEDKFWIFKEFKSFK